MGSGCQFWPEGDWAGELGGGGVLTMQTKAITSTDGVALPSENMSVLRLRRRVFNQNSYVGIMTISRLGTDGRYNVAYGVDGIFRVVKQNFLAINWAQTFDNTPTYARRPAES